MPISRSLLTSILPHKFRPRCWSVCYRKVTGPLAHLPRASLSLWVLDFVQERLHNTSPGDFESMFITAEDSVKRKGLGQKTGECVGESALVHWEVKVTLREVRQGGLLPAHQEVREKGALERSSRA